MKQLAFYTRVFFLLLAIGFASWKVQRWAHWKFSYAGMIEPRIEQLERRVDAIERSQKEVK